MLQSLKEGMIVYDLHRIRNHQRQNMQKIRCKTNGPSKTCPVTRIVSQGVEENTTLNFEQSYFMKIIMRQ